MSRNADTTARMPRGSQHLYGTLYKIPFSAIRTPDPDDGPSADYKFRNPRILTEKGQADLLDRKLSLDLRESIKKKTMLNPIVCRWVDDPTVDELIPVVIGGDRRYRSLEYLIRKKEMVVDPRIVNRVVEASADIAYEFVVCQVFFCDTDLHALSLAWAENKNRINLTDGHEVAEVIKLRDCDATDDQIMEILQQDARWLASTDRLISSLDANTLADLLEGRIDRPSAARLASISDDTVRESVRTEASAAAEQRHQRRVKRMDNHIENARAREEIEEAAAEISDTQEERDAAAARAAVARTEATTVARRRQTSKPVITSREMRRAEDSVGSATESTQPESSPPKRKIMREKGIDEGRAYLRSVIRNRGVVEDDAGSFEADVNALKLAVRLLENNILSNNCDWRTTLRRHFRRSK